MDLSVSLKGVHHPTAKMEADAETLLRALQLPEAELSIVLCTDPFIRKLNRQWRKKDQPTDVLSFAMKEGQQVDGSEQVLGDLVISLDTARKQAKEQAHSLETELQVLLVHGLLHLLGHDHLTPTDAEKMRREEARLLTLLSTPGQGLIARADLPSEPS